MKSMKLYFKRFNFMTIVKQEKSTEALIINYIQRIYNKCTLRSYFDTSLTFQDCKRYSQRNYLRTLLFCEE